MSSSGLQALTVSTVVLCMLLLLLMVVPRPATGMLTYQRQDPSSRSYYDDPYNGYYYHPSIQEICSRREKLYVYLYDCLRNRGYMCWLMLKSLEKLKCQEPCYKFRDRRCVYTRKAHTDRTCTPVRGICESGQTCCKFPQI